MPRHQNDIPDGEMSISCSFCAPIYPPGNTSNHNHIATQTLMYIYIYVHLLL